MHTNTWILLADSSRALLYSVQLNSPEWTLINEYSHSASRVSAGGLCSDQPGRSRGYGVGGSAHSALESQNSPKEIEFAAFAHKLIEVLDEGHGQQAYARLVLVAPPHFLGLLRKGLSHTLSKLVVASADKDYLHISQAEMQLRLEPLLEGIIESKKTAH